MKLLIATKSDLKIEGISNAFRKLFPEEEIVIQPVEAESFVGRQPLDNQVFLGAKNRIMNAKEIYADFDFDYVIGCESGLISQFDNWYNVQIVIIENENCVQVSGMSAAFEISKQYFKEIRETSLKQVMDNLFDGKGGISYLTGGLYSRPKLVEDATIMAFSKYNW